MLALTDSALARLAIAATAPGPTAGAANGSLLFVLGVKPVNGSYLSGHSGLSLDLPIGVGHRPRDGSVVSFLHCMNDPRPEGHMASYIGRRELLAALGGAAGGWPLAARAQQGERVRRLGVSRSADAGDPKRKAQLFAFTEELAALGWADGPNLGLEIR
jgi:hypothetical protein